MCYGNGVRVHDLRISRGWSLVAREVSVVGAGRVQGEARALQHEQASTRNHTAAELRQFKSDVFDSLKYQMRIMEALGSLPACVGRACV